MAFALKSAHGPKIVQTDHEIYIDTKSIINYTVLCCFGKTSLRSTQVRMLTMEKPNQ